jgi:RNase P subunit RPR2
LREELQLKNERIKELEKNEKRAVSDKEKADSYARQVKEISEKVKMAIADRDMIENEKKYLDEKIKK